MWVRVVVFYLTLKSCKPYNLKKSTPKESFYYWQYPPPKMGSWHYWVMQLSTRHLNNMTAELARDVEVKYRMIKSVTDGSKEGGKDDEEAAQYQIGQIAAEMKARFKHMVQIYVTYARYNDMAVNNEYTHPKIWVEKRNRDVKNYIYAYMYIESDYNELMMFNDMFYECLALREKHSQLKLQKELLALNKTLQLSKLTHEKTSVKTTTDASETTTTATQNTTTSHAHNNTGGRFLRTRHRHHHRHHHERRKTRSRPTWDALQGFAD